LDKNDIRVYNYCDYSNSNYGSSRAIKIGSLTLYFSYDTIVAVDSPHVNLIRKNSWSVTTGKHLNAINPDKNVRLDSDVFEEQLSRVLHRYELVEIEPIKIEVAKH